LSCLEPVNLGQLKLRNRLVVAAMSRMQANDDGTVSRDMPEYYARYARYGAGIVVSEALYTDEVAARAYFKQPGLATDAQAQGWRRITDAVHHEGGVVFAQLQHGGRLSEPGLNPLHLSASDGAASGLTWQTGRPNAPASAATRLQIADIVDGFVKAAQRAVVAGFDGIELHGARGYLLDDFLSASSNLRTDEYGGSLEGRLALPLQVVRAVRESIGSLPLSYNLSMYKMDDAGYSPPGGKAEVEAIVRALQNTGVQIFHVTTRKVMRAECWGEPLTRTVREASPDAVVIGNGALRDIQDCDEALAATGADLISLARSFLANPDWIGRCAAGGALKAYSSGMERLPLLQGESLSFVKR
jgi:2,4-dienoyl-CoA reductase-like NADH-dependent reductase (Old Yellow Enzyme family)